MKRISKHKGIESLILFLIFISITRLIITGGLSAYVHPRYNIFIIVSVIFLGGIVVSLFISSKNENKRISAIRIGLLLFAVLIIFVPGGSPATNSANGSKSLPQSSSLQSNDEEKLPVIIANAREERSIEITESNMFQITQDVYDNPEIYKGKSITIVGTAMLQKGLSENNSFAIVRLMMTCCAADLQPVGFICTSKESLSVRRSSWYTVSGVLNTKIEKKNIIPIIEITSIASSVRPDNEYIYPFQ